MMRSSDEDVKLEAKGVQEPDTHPDDKYGGHEARAELERKLVRKIDLRMSILIFIYILNYASL